MKRGLLLVNLGTPDAPLEADVRRYLAEFLGDPRVLDMNALGRWLLLHLIILPRRPAKSAELYRKIWTEQGSPLLVYSQALAAGVRQALGGEFEVALAMRYGNPSVAAGLAELKAKQVAQVVVLPLYPQYATSTTQSTLEQVKEVAAREWPEVKLGAVPAFYGHPAFLDAFADVARPVLAQAQCDHVLFSFHGLPARQVTRLDATGQHCLRKPTCCEEVGLVNRDCYRAQSMATARSLAARLGLPAGAFSVGFQSRLGKGWLEPFTDGLVLELAAKKVRRLAVLCPAFVADCLETLEEIGLRAREAFLEAGGEELVLVPSLNDHPAWVAGVSQLAREVRFAPKSLSGGT
jgi:ferrochelatase